MKNNYFVPFRTTPLVRVWFPSGKQGSPLVCAWVDSASAPVHPKIDSPPTQELERLPLCV
jgi:hypothetical protein